MTAPALLATRGLAKRFGSLVVAEDIAIIELAGHGVQVLRADRPQRRRAKTTR